MLALLALGASGSTGCGKEKPRQSPAAAVPPPAAVPSPAKPAPAAQPNGAAAPVATAVAMGDVNAAHQLEGFHEIEESTWRWTKQRFAVSLLAPTGAKERGARLRFRFTIPPSAFAKYGAQQVSAKVEAAGLPPQAYRQAGQHEFSAEVPSTALQNDVVRVEFVLDKSFVVKPDERNLGVVAQHVALEAN
jgi:hypothetical protein